MTNLLKYRSEKLIYGESTCHHAMPIMKPDAPPPPKRLIKFSVLSQPSKPLKNLIKNHHGKNKWIILMSLKLRLMPRTV